jgi:hypothetical protein
VGCGQDQNPIEISPLSNSQSGLTRDPIISIPFTPLRSLGLSRTHHWVECPKPSPSLSFVTTLSLLITHPHHLISVSRPGDKVDEIKIQQPSFHYLGGKTDTHRFRPDPSRVIVPSSPLAPSLPLSIDTIGTATLTFCLRHFLSRVVFLRVRSGRSNGKQAEGISLVWLAGRACGGVVVLGRLGYFVISVIAYEVRSSNEKRGSHWPRERQKEAVLV